MEDQWRITPHESEWKRRFNDIAIKLRDSLGNLAVRIDHIGSTSIIGLDAKPIIDIQISVLNFDDVLLNKSKIESMGFVLRQDNPDQTKLYFRELPGMRRTHVHVRQAGSFSEQISLLFRDYLREHPSDCLRYVQEKHRLMGLFKNERENYVEGKGPIVWGIIQKAHMWSQKVGWKPGISDM